MSGDATPVLTITGTESIVGGLQEMIRAWGSLHVESGTDVRNVLVPSGGLPLNMVVGEGVHDVMSAIRPDKGSALLIISPEPLEVGSPSVLVGLHGFSTRPALDGSFPLPLIDDWGIDDVMAAAFDSVAAVGSVGNSDSLGVLIDLAVLDLAFERGSLRARPGGMDPRRLGRAAFLSGRNPQVSRVGLVAAVAQDHPDLGQSHLSSYANLAHVALSFCAGVAAR